MSTRMREVPGGKARSIGVPNSAQDGRKPLPGEHGFRFFPGFYRHVPDTMNRIPCGKGKRVSDNLVLPQFTLIARADGKGDLIFPAQPPASPWHLFRHMRPLFENNLGIPERDLHKFVAKLLILLTSCDERRMDYEKQTWLTFVEADGPGVHPNYKKYCADGLTRTLVACQAAKMSARTGGYILLQLLFDLARPGVQANRVLNGPTGEAWLDPWLTHLRNSGRERFKFHERAEVREFHFDGGLITGVTIASEGSTRLVTADYYVCALPVDVLEPVAVDGSVVATRPLITPEMKAFDASLSRLNELQTEWMNGIQFYLDKDLWVVEGHTLYIDSPWSLTSISQQQFWSSKLPEYGDGTVQGVLSVDISDWNTKGHNQRTARECTPEQIKDEVWQQIETALNDDEKPELAGVTVVRWFLDDSIRFPNPNLMSNAEPLLINTAGSWDCRPEAVTGIKNFFLAGDYVRTHTDLATMESANESARRAVNGILKASGSRKRCKVWPLSEPRIFAPFRLYDRWRFRRGLPHNAFTIRLALWLAVPIWYVLRFVFSLYYMLVDWWLAPIYRSLRG